MLDDNIIVSKHLIKNILFCWLNPFFGESIIPLIMSYAYYELYYFYESSEHEGGVPLICDYRSMIVQ